MIKKLPTFIKFVLSVLLIELAILAIFRAVFYFYFNDNYSNMGLSSVLYAFWVGFRFDVQLIALINLPILLFANIKYINIFKNSFARYIWATYIILSFVGILAIYIVNFVYFDFFKHPVNSEIIRYFYDFSNAFSMLVDGFHIIPIISVILISMVLLLVYINKKIKNTIIASYQNRRFKFGIYTLFVAFYLFVSYGKLELYPWRWSEAFYSPNKYVSYLASNPVTYFVNTLKNSGEKYIIEKSQKNYDEVAEFLNIKDEDKDTNKLHLIRDIVPNHLPKYTFDKPNIVYILGESTSYARSSLSGNPLDATPYLNYMSQNGLTYSRYYTPYAGTARSVWTSLTSVYDAEHLKTSSRNPMIVNQNSLLNYVNDYEKHYFIGGSLSWGNIRGVISNINGVITHEKKDYQNSPDNGVWGISDIHLANEANEIFKKQTKPFFAFVQFAGNHSPNTIPEENFGFKKTTNISKEDLKKYSFDGSISEYNGQSFLDYSLKRLITLAKKEEYFKNTIFIFVGDHGLNRRGDHMHEAEQTFATATLHTPLVIYAPHLIKHKKIDYCVSEIDIMATMVALMGDKYTNSAFGRDLLDKDFDDKDHFAFYMSHEANPTISLMGNKYIFRIKANGDDARLYEYYYDKKGENLIKKYPKIAQKMEKLVRGLYESNRYVRYHNSNEEIKKYKEKNR